MFYYLHCCKTLLIERGKRRRDDGGGKEYSRQQWKNNLNRELFFACVTLFYKPNFLNNIKLIYYLIIRMKIIIWLLFDYLNENSIFED